MRSLFLCAVLLSLVVVPSARASGSYTVTASGTTNYLLNGIADPNLVLVRGHTYTFDVQSFGHPFYIKTVKVSGSGSQYNSGVTNNGAEGDVVTFVVPLDAPDQLFYVCGVHIAMAGNLNIIDGGLPMSSGWWIALTAAMLVGAGAWMLRRRQSLAV